MIHKFCKKIFNLTINILNLFKSMRSTVEFKKNVALIYILTKWKFSPIYKTHKLIGMLKRTIKHPKRNLGIFLIEFQYSYQRENLKVLYLKDFSDCSQ